MSPAHISSAGSGIVRTTAAEPTTSKPCSRSHCWPPSAPPCSLPCLWPAWPLWSACARRTPLLWTAAPPARGSAWGSTPPWCLRGPCPSRMASRWVRRLRNATPPSIHQDGHSSWDDRQPVQPTAAGSHWPGWDIALHALPTLPLSPPQLAGGEGARREHGGSGQAGQAPRHAVG